MGTLFYKYKKIDANLFDSLSNAYLYLSSPQQLNDPFDCRIIMDYNATDEEILNWIKDRKTKVIPDSRAFEMIKKGILDQFNDDDFYNDFFGIFCLTNNPINEKMWANYGDNYSGVCLGYNTLYSNGAHLISVKPHKCHMRYCIKLNGKYFSVLVPVVYDKIQTKTYSFFKRNIEVIKEGYRHKTPKWSEEQEQRLVFLNSNHENSDAFRRLNYDQNILKEVVFGSNVSNKEIDDIKNAISKKHKRNIKYYRIKSNSKSLCLEKEIFDA